MRIDVLRNTIGLDILQGNIAFKLELSDEEKKVLESPNITTISVDGVDKTGKSSLLNHVIKIRREVSKLGCSPRERKTNPHFRYYGGDGFIDLGKFTIVKRHNSQCKNICFVRSGIHSRVIRAANRAMVDFGYNQSASEKKYSRNLIRLRGEELRDYRIKRYVRDHLFYREMFDLFHADYISMLKKIVRIIKNHNVEVLVFDRSWVSNYAYNRYHFFLDDKDIGSKVFNNQHYRLRLNYLFLTDMDRLLKCHSSASFNPYDFYESYRFNPYFPFIDEFIRYIGATKEVDNFIVFDNVHAQVGENAKILYAHQLRDFDRVIEGFDIEHRGQITDTINNRYYEIIDKEFQEMG